MADTDNSQTMPACADFAGKVAVVLGASAEGGIGWVTAELLAAKGAKLVVASRSIEPLHRLASRIGGSAVACDSTDEDQVKALAQRALDLHGRVDIAVNSAGCPVTALIEDVTRNQLEEALGVNYLANVYFVKYMARAIGSDGSIVLISSMASTHPFLPNAPYGAAKAATDSLVRYAALEYGSRRIRVNSVLPGSTLTNMAFEALSDPALRKAVEHEIPLGRIALAQDQANAILWLAGPSFVTGLNLQVNGGNHLGRLPFLSELPTPDAVNASRLKPLGDR